MWGLPLKQESEEATGCSGHAKQLIHLGGSPASFSFGVVYSCLIEVELCLLRLLVQDQQDVQPDIT